MERIEVNLETGEQIVIQLTQEEIDALPVPVPPSYKELRQAEYPPMAEYLDGIVKGDIAQQQSYIDACLAVKLKYPKV